jgi:hypothetical protein
VLEKFGLPWGLISFGIGLVVFWFAFVNFKETGETKKWPLG